MIRLVVAVAVGVALLAAATPAVERTAADRADQRLAAFAQRLSGAAERVARSAPAPAGLPGARETVRVRLPAGSLTAARVDRVRIECAGRRGLRVAYAVAGAPRERVVSVPAPVAVSERAASGRASPAAGDELVVTLGFRLVDRARLTDRPTAGRRPTVTVRIGHERSNGKPRPLVACSTRPTGPVGVGPR